MRIAGVQCDIKLKDREHNLAKIANSIRETSSMGARLTVFPECAVAGYCFASKEEAMEFAEPIPGPATEWIAQVCRELNHHVVVGMVEQDDSHIFNAAVLVGPNGVAAVHRKNPLAIPGRRSVYNSREPTVRRSRCM